MDTILSLTPPIAAVSLFFYMRYQSKLAEEDDRRMFPGYKPAEQSHSLLQEKFIDLVHLSCSQASWLPIFIKVYFLGVFECIINTFQKYILPSQQGSRDNQIESLIAEARDNQSRKKTLAVITGGDSGIGLELAKALIDSGMDIIISEYISFVWVSINDLGMEPGLIDLLSAGRSDRQLQNAVQRVKASVNANDDQISGIKLELSNFEDVHGFVRKLKNHLDGRPVDIFVSKCKQI
jgi:hypothetical protein